MPGAGISMREFAPGGRMRNLPHYSLGDSLPSGVQLIRLQPRVKI